MEIATDRDEPVCGGTAAFMDAHLEAVAELLGETLSDRVFVRYEWTEVDGGVTVRRDGHVRVRSGVLPNEHELVHAVHREVWPATRPFLHEGLAVLLDSRAYLRQTWPEGRPLDAVLEADSPGDLSYNLAWYVVSQIVRDHGFDGLRTLWHAVPPDATAAEIRASYEELFGEPLDVIFEPAEVQFPGEPYEMIVPRATCHFNVCAGEPLELSGIDAAPVFAEAPSSCLDDPHAIGSTHGHSGGDVWASWVLPLEPGRHRFVTSGGAAATVVSCGLRCDPYDTSPWSGVDVDDTLVDDFREYWPGPFRFEVGRESVDLPTAVPGGLSVERLPP